MKVKKLKVYLRGTKFIIGLKYLLRVPDSLLGKVGEIVNELWNEGVGECDDREDVIVTKLKQLTDQIEEVWINEEYIVMELNRTPVLFHYILDIYVCGNIHLPSAFCAKLVKQEMRFWGVSDKILVTCCWAKLREEQEKQVTLERVQEEWGISGTPAATSAILKTRAPSKIFFEEPRSSRQALLYSWVQLLAVFLSVLGLTLETVPDLREASAEIHYNYTTMTSRRLEHFFKNSRPTLWLRLMDAAVIISIIIDCTARFIVTSHRTRFFINIFNIIDIMVIIPSIVVFALNMIGTASGYSEALNDVIFVLNIVRVFRVLRIFRLMTHYKSLKILLWAWKTSYRELVLLLVILCLFCCIYGSLVFYVEIVYDNFMNIPQGLWWAVVTMTTVGYGDIHPVSIGGYCVGTVCAITGLVVVAMPVPIIVQNFGRYYYAVQTCERLQRQHKLARKEEEDKQGYNEGYVPSSVPNGGNSITSTTGIQ